MGMVAILVMWPGPFECLKTVDDSRQRPNDTNEPSAQVS